MATSISASSAASWSWDPPDSCWLGFPSRARSQPSSAGSGLHLCPYPYPPCSCRPLWALPGAGSVPGKVRGAEGAVLLQHSPARMAWQRDAGAELAAPWVGRGKVLWTSPREATGWSSAALSPLRSREGAICALLFTLRREGALSELLPPEVAFSLLKVGAVRDGERLCSLAI